MEGLAFFDLVFNFLSSCNKKGQSNINSPEWRQPSLRLSLISLLSFGILMKEKKKSLWGETHENRVVCGLCFLKFKKWICYVLGKRLLLKTLVTENPNCGHNLGDKDLSSWFR